MKGKINDLASCLLFSRRASFWKVLESWVTTNSKSGTKSFFCISIDLGNDYICFSKCWSQFFICWCKSLAVTTPWKNEIHQLRNKVPSQTSTVYMCTLLYKSQRKQNSLKILYYSYWIIIQINFHKKSTCIWHTIPNKLHFHISCQEGGKELRNLSRREIYSQKLKGHFQPFQPLASIKKNKNIKTSIFCKNQVFTHEILSYQ